MTYRQLTLWDNIELESGYRCLGNLDFAEALPHLDKAIRDGTGDKPAAQKIKEAALYWQSRLQLADEPASPETILDLSTDFKMYPFTPGMSGFRKAIIIHISGLPGWEHIRSYAGIETVFDQLLDIKNHELAERFVLSCFNRYPENKNLLYLLGQATWVGGKFLDSGKYYTLALLHCPFDYSPERILIPRLKEIIRVFGPEMTPAYGWLRNILPLIELPPGIIARNPGHIRSLELYRLIIEAENAVSNHDMKSAINFRKQLKSADPGLYREYFDLLKQRKGHL